VTIEDRLRALQITIPEAPRPVGAYVPALRTGNLIFTSGQIPTVHGTLRFTGKVPSETSEDDAYQAARLAAINALAAIRGVEPDLNRIRRVVRLTGYVNSDDGFSGQPAVLNGASQLLLDLFGEAGRHVRSAVGVNELPLDAAVEVELIVELEP
jgi:enamine deaminase RidA (YjgF/YER057c/UK114 family)